MIASELFYKAYVSFRPEPNAEQGEVVDAPPGAPLFIVAGPGTGKTATLSLRILKLIFVDDIPPRGILATTFTKKAAGELRSRILSWGYRLQEALLTDPGLNNATKERIRKVDINQVITGTIDSICEQLLREFRDPGAQPPVLADDFVTKTLLLREGLFQSGAHKDDGLDKFLFSLSGLSSTWGWHTGAKNDLVQEIWERRFQDQVDWDSFVRNGQGDQRARDLLEAVLNGYYQALSERGMLDFSLLEQRFLERVRAGQPEEFLSTLRVLLVDEYQDTNLLQESIYLAMARHCGGALTVVGDDDQSLYRFRGATVELFSDFAGRYARIFDRRPEPVFLRTNYRSTERIIGAVNNYARLDSSFQSVRVSAKPALLTGPNAGEGLPVLGLFRNDLDTLATSLADFVAAVFRGEGFRLPNGQVIQRAEQRGDLGDCALLCSSPAEYNSSDKPRLPWHLRQEMGRRGIQLFNPRGQTLTEIELVMRFGGLLLECLDPGGVVEAQTSGLNQDMMATFATWRTAAVDYAQSSAAPAGLVDFAVGWAERNPRRVGWEWPRSVPILDLLYGLVHYFPALYDDPEGQIYLEVFTRQISACEQVGKFSGRVVYDPADPGLGEASVKELLRDFLGPIAAGAVKVNEELMDAFPRDRFNILSIHQSKGLEFPLVIVDVGSDFKTNHHAHAFKRFPSQGGRPHVLEDTLRPFTPLGTPGRPQRDRAFDDLYRQFFVAYSRPQQVLLLVGNRKTFPGGAVPNVATGWMRNSICGWARAVPFVEI